MYELSTINSVFDIDIIEVKNKLLHFIETYKTGRLEYLKTGFILSINKHEVYIIPLKNYIKVLIDTSEYCVNESKFLQFLKTLL